MPVQETSIALLGFLLNCLRLYHRAIKRRFPFFNREETRKAALRQVSSKIAESGLVQDILKFYYGSSLPNGLKIYEGTLCENSENVTFSSTIATKPEWIGLNVPLNKDRRFGKFSLNDKALDYPFDELELKKSKDYRKAIRVHKDLDPKVWDHPSFRLLGIEIQKTQLEAHFGLSKFLPFRLSSGLTLEELVVVLRSKKKKLYRIIERIVLKDTSVLTRINERLSLRRLFLPSDKFSMKNLEYRSCLGGIQGVVALKKCEKENEYLIPIARRSADVAHSPLLYSTLPKGYHQPSVNAKEEVNLYWTVLREVFEELLGGKEVERGKARLKHDWYLSGNGAMGDLASYLDKNMAEIVVTCFGFNLEIGNYEFGILVVIDDEKFFQDNAGSLQLNWEASRELNCPLLSTKKDKDRISKIILSPNWEPDNRPAFLEALRWLGEHRSVDVPKIEPFKFSGKSR